jgi:hypothetical protein
MRTRICADPLYGFKAARLAAHAAATAAFASAPATAPATPGPNAGWPALTKPGHIESTSPRDLSRTDEKD